jgi:superfamily I DNA/RNA helicase
VINVTPARVLPVTFTKVAAEDLQRELVNMGVAGCDQIRGSTLHSLGMRILSRQNVLAVTGRIARSLSRFEVEPLLYDLPVEFGKSESELNAFAHTKQHGHGCNMNSRGSHRHKRT